MQGVCPGLTHGQKFGIIYVGSTTDDESVNERETVQRHSTVVVTNQNFRYSTSDEQNHDNSQESRQEGILNDPHPI